MARRKVRKSAGEVVESHDTSAEPPPHPGDTLPPGARVRLGTNRLNHVIQRGNTGVSHIAFSPNGRYLLGVGYEDNEASLWELPSGREVWRRDVEGASEPIASSAFSPDGRLLVIAGCGGTSLYETETGRKIRRLGDQGGTMNCSPVFSPCGRFLIQDRSVRRVSDWKITAQLEDGFEALTFSPDGDLIAGGNRKLVYVREWPSGRFVKRLKGPTGPINAVRFLPNGQIAASAEDETVRVWEIASGRELHSYQWGEARHNPFPAAFQPGGRALALTYPRRGEPTQVMDIETGEVLREFESGQGQRSPHCLAWSPDGRTLAVAEDGRCHLWDMETGIDTAPPGRHYGQPDRVVFNADGRRAVTCGVCCERDAYVWDAITGDLLGTVPPMLMEQPRTLTLSPDGAHVATYNAGKLFLWEVGSEHPQEFPVEAVPLLAWSESGNSLFASVRGTVTLYIPGKRRGTVLSPNARRLHELPTLPDGRVVWRDQEQLKLLDRLGQPVADLSDPIPGFLMAISSDGLSVVAETGSTNGDLILASYSLHQPDAPTNRDATGNALPTHSPFNVPEDFGRASYNGWGHSEEFLADGRLLVAACRGSHEAGGPFVVKVWEAATGLEVWESPVFSWGIAEVVFAPGGRSLAVALDDATTVIFDVPVRPTSIHPGWLTSTVMALARAIRADHAFERLPILADALQDAGCEDLDILNLCRNSSTTHVRGRWVVDLVLGKE